MKRFKCPRCRTVSVCFPALSRLDNKTEICNHCGVDEALQDFVGVPLTNFVSTENTEDEEL